jgi:translation elongation factor EF-G
MGRCDGLQSFFHFIPTCLQLLYDRNSTRSDPTLIHPHTNTSTRFLIISQIYSGTVKKGDFVTNSSNGKRVRVPRLVRVHSDELEDIPAAVSRWGVG